MNDEWLQENYERAALIAATVIAVAIAGWLLFSSLSFADDFESQGVDPSSDLPDLQMDVLEAGKTSLKTAETLDGERVFASIYVIEGLEGGQPVLNPVTPDSPDIHPNIKNAWVLHYKLDIARRDLESRDADGDGFSNVEEFWGKTDPTNDQEKPAWITKLCLANMVSSDLFLTYKGSVDGVNQQIDINSKQRFPSSQELVKKAESFGPGKLFKLLDIKPKSEITDQGVQVNTSEIIVSYRPEGETESVKETLIYNQQWELPTHTGNFLDRATGEEEEIKRGENFNLREDPNNSFTLLEVTAEGAKVADSNNEIIEVPTCP